MKARGGSAFAGPQDAVRRKGGTPEYVREPDGNPASTSQSQPIRVPASLDRVRLLAIRPEQWTGQ
jgi:hypothetical protein